MAFVNEGTWDRAVRILLGALLLFVAWTTWPGAIATALLVVGGIALLTGIAGYCLLYKLLHVSTKRTAAA